MNLALRTGYDDNANTSPTAKEGSIVTIVEPQLLLNFPRERTFFGLRYTYRAVYFASSSQERVEHTHTADLLFSHVFTPRLVLDASDQVRQGISPELVELSSGVPVITRRRGDFLYNNAQATLSYNLTRRWTTSINGSWDFWSYDDPTTAADNDRNGYRTTLSAVYALSARSSVGLNYQYGIVDYDFPGTNSFRNSTSHVGFLSAVRRFSPKMSAQMNGGIELREFGDGTSQVGPSVNGALTYNYARDSSVSAGGGYSISTTEVGDFRSTDTVSVFGRISHALTYKLRGSATVGYSMASFQNPSPLLPPTSGGNEEGLTVSTGLTYAFTRWLNGEVNYSYSQVTSDIAGRGFDRNFASVGMRFIY